MAERSAAEIAADYDGVALVLQGGGALGAYQAGAFEALTEQDIAPTWIAGTSIGAINAALIAGNAPDERCAALRTRRTTPSTIRAVGQITFQWISPKLSARTRTPTTTRISPRATDGFCRSELTRVGRDDETSEATADPGVLAPPN